MQLSKLMRHRFRYILSMLMLFAASAPLWQAKCSNINIAGKMPVPFNTFIDDDDDDGGHAPDSHEIFALETQYIFFTGPLNGFIKAGSKQRKKFHSTNTMRAVWRPPIF